VTENSNPVNVIIAFRVIKIIILKDSPSVLNAIKPVAPTIINEMCCKNVYFHVKLHNQRGEANSIWLTIRLGLKVIITNTLS
jgi:hypothetical protein